MTAQQTDRANQPLVGVREADHTGTVFSDTGSTPLLAVGRLVRLSIGTAWRLLLAVELGILVAIVVLCAVPLYANLTANVQIQSALESGGPRQRNVELVASSNYVASSLQQQEDAAMRPIGQHYLAGFTQRGVVSHSLVADTMGLAFVNGRPVPLLPLRPPIPVSQISFMAYYDSAQLTPHIRLLAGALPRPLPSGSQALPQAIVTAQMASQLHLHLGDELTVASLTSATTPAVVQVGVQVIGVWEPYDPNDNFWNGQSFLANPLDLPDVPYVYPVLLDPTTFLTTLSTVPNEGMEQQWTFYTASTRISTANIAAVVDSVGALRTSVGTVTVPGMRRIDILTGLDTSLSAVIRELSLLQLPLYAMAVLVVGLALLYVATMGDLVVEAQRGLVATLRSRGASSTQVLAPYVALGLLLGGIGAAVGPWLAGALAVVWVTHVVPASTLASAHVTTDYLRAVARPATAIVPAVGGGLLGGGALVLAGWQAAQSDVLSFRREQGRSTQPPFWRRYYLDLLLVAVAAAAYVELTQFGSLSSREAVGAAAHDILLFATPGLLLLAGALLLLRIFPAYAAAGARAGTRSRGPVGVLAFARLARGRPVLSRLALLLALTVALGLFALTFAATLTRSASDRAAYEAGADVRVVAADVLTGNDEATAASTLLALPGVRRITPAYRTSFTTSSDSGNLPVSLLAIDPATWAATAGSTSWRGDYAGVPLSALMRTLQAHQWHLGTPARGQPTPGDAGHPVWALMSATLADALHVKVGQPFVLDNPQAANPDTVFLVGAIVQAFPTLYPGQAPGGFLVTGLQDAEGLPSSWPVGPNEFWMQTSSAPARHAALLQALAIDGGNIGIINTVDRETVYATISGDPLQASMRGLLLGGAVLAVALAALGTLVEASLAARQQTLQFAILRTLGISVRQVVRVLLAEQGAVYGFGLLGGTLLGGLLATATLPYLQFASALSNPTTVGAPPALLVVDPGILAAFCAALIAALAGALLVAWVSAARRAVSRTLRLGED